jgi:hypothetical protein
MTCRTWKAISERGRARCQQEKPRKLALNARVASAVNTVRIFQRPAGMALAGLLLSISGCSLQPKVPVVSGPQTQIQGAPVGKTHPRFAPPPAVESHWDARLGVYVLDAERATYYRERTFYRWTGNWTRADTLHGPWERVERSAVPPALFRAYSH